MTAFNADLLNPGDILALEQGVPETRWNVAIQQRAGRVGLLGRLHYYGSCGPASVPTIVTAWP